MEERAWWSWLQRSVGDGLRRQGSSCAPARSVPLLLQNRVEAAWFRRWSNILACSAGRSECDVCGGRCTVLFLIFSRKKHVNTAGVDTKSAAEKRPLGDTTFHLSSVLAPVKIYHDVARRFEAESQQPCLRASRIELVRSFQSRVSEPHAFTETCQRCAELAPL